MSSHASSSARPRRRGRVAAWLTAMILAGGLYLLLIDTTSLPELIVAVGAAAIAATGYELAREQQTVGGIGIRLRWLTRGYRALSKVPTDIAFVSLAALRQLVHPQAVNGHFRAVPFHCGAQHDIETGRMALAESLGSFPPNTIVIGVDVERELILGHQLRPSGGADAIDVLGLGSE